MSAKSTERPADISIVLCGSAGQGVQTVEKLMTRIIKKAGFNVFATKEYMSRVRGGLNSTLIRTGGQPVTSFIDRVDIFVPLSKGAVGHLGKRISEQTVFLGEKKIFEDEIEDDTPVIDIPFTEIAEELGNKIYSNTVAIGALAGVLNIELKEAAESLKQYFGNKDREVVEKNIEALETGYRKAGEREEKTGIDFNLDPDPEIRDQILVSGSDAVGLGAIAAGCNFISSYPMSPSTAVLVFLAGKGRDFGVLAEQAEDEIAAINMAVGAWYAGARGMVTTSGGGLSLMTEGISLAAMLETPVVIHLAQRPGPATGLPTRTEQGDLELALHAGHGEFPRIILAPGTLEQGFDLARKAFNLADKFQVPVFLLTDQYFMDSYYNTSPFELSGFEVNRNIVKTGQGYKRYQLTEDGISPRGIPGYGEGLVCVDSDEHDEKGHITEDLEMRNRMVEKRLKKLDSIRKEAEEPALYGGTDYHNLVICWGSTLNIVREAVQILSAENTSVLHFSQVNPLHDKTAEIINKAETVSVVENNATAQFARLLENRTGVKIGHNVLKYDGLSFASDTLAGKLKEIFQG
ncbi:MAG: 2-oxoacid:acceptor oxidoreductase subunit alpha [Candidatus Krumholzibacteriales bacterium]